MGLKKTDSSVITKDFASIIPDGQVTASNKKSVQGDFKKIIKINNFLIGFTAPVELLKATVKEWVKYGL